MTCPHFPRSGSDDMAAPCRHFSGRRTRIFPLTTQSLSDTISPDCMHLATIARSHRRHAPETQPPASLSRAESRGLSRSTLFSPQPSPHTCKLSNSPALQTANARAFRGYRPATRLRVARPNLLGINTCELVAPSSLQQLLLIQQLPYTPGGGGWGVAAPRAPIHHSSLACPTQPRGWRVPPPELSPYAVYLYQASPAKAFLMLSMSKTREKGQECPSDTSTLYRKSTYSKIRPSKTSLFTRFFVTFSSKSSTLLHPQRRLSVTPFAFCLASIHHSPVICLLYPVIPSPLFSDRCIAMFFHPYSFQHYASSPRGGYPPSFSIQPSSFQ